jgi:hypothetical protein
VDSKLKELTKSSNSSNFSTSATLSRRRLLLARVGWLAIFVLTIGLFSASIPAQYDHLISLSDPKLEPATVRANLEANGISIDFYATYLLSISVASAAAWVAVGVVIFWRRSDDWIALFTSLTLITFGTFSIAYDPAVLAVQNVAVGLPIRLLALFGSASMLLFFFLFPDGRFVPRWTRWMVIFWAVFQMGYFLFPGSFLDIYRSSPLINFVTITAFACIVVGSQLYRYRRVSGPVQRQQTKSVVFGTVVAMIGTVGFGLPLYASLPNAQYGEPYTLASEAGIFGSLLLIPLSIGVAIIRHRLWAIDIVINRTLVYGALTALLAAGYVATIMALQGIVSLVFQVPFRALTGQESALATVGATLAMATLFNPLRHRIQSFIDRRFYRRKYDARKTLENFSATLRDETDLEALSDDLVEAVRETMQPAHVSLWLHPDPPLKDKKKRAAIRESAHDE